MKLFLFIIIIVGMWTQWKKKKKLLWKHSNEWIIETIKAYGKEKKLNRLQGLKVC